VNRAPHTNPSLKKFPLGRLGLRPQLGGASYKPS
jgi:hypothetical protein